LGGKDEAGTGLLIDLVDVVVISGDEFLENVQVVGFD
jgi:hypothetical protein